MKSLIFTLFLLVATTPSFGQQNQNLDDLKFYADIIANAGNPLHKERAHSQFQSLFDSWLKSEEFNQSDLESIQWLSVKKPEDESFVIVTWQLALNENDNKYFGYLIKDGQITTLVSNSFENDLEYDVFSANEWTGALYYNIHTVVKNGEPNYILFGYNRFKNYEHRKIADVLTFEDGKPIFGKELFKQKKEGSRDILRNRLVLDYSNDSNVSLNYNPSLGMIVFDHLISRIGRIPGQGPTMLPDGSYVGYKWDGEYFNYVDKIYDHTYDEAPVPKPVLNEGGKNRNIFGKQVESKGKKN